MSFSQLSDYIILFGALTVAITNIIKFIKTPHTFLKQKQEEKEEEKDKEIQERIDNTIKEKMPIILSEHEVILKERYALDKQQHYEEIKEEILKDTKELLDGILQINLEQNEQIKILYRTSKDVLRQRIMAIYHTYKKEKRFPIHAKEALDELYKDYKAENGNSYIDKYYARMCTWETYDDELYI